MAIQVLLISCFMLSLIVVVGRVKACDGVRRLFVLGDSFADTGNAQNPNLPYYSLRRPYGEVYPGYPTGRWSNGKVMADFVADYLGFPSPLPYTKRQQIKVEVQRHGMNFARGGTGVFDTFTGLPSLTEQIDELQQLIESGVYPHSLDTSIALVSYAGNDYRVYFEKGGSMEGLSALRQKVMDQLASDLQRLHRLGVKKVIVSNLQAIGCSPSSTYAVSYSQCVNATNDLAVIHNQLLQAAVAPISPPISILDNYNAFLTVLQDDFSNRLKACCLGTNINIWCGTIAANGTKEYTSCREPERAFWWDNNHPTHSAWRKVVKYHHPSLRKFRD